MTELPNGSIKIPANQAAMLINALDDEEDYAYYLWYNKNKKENDPVIEPPSKPKPNIDPNFLEKYKKQLYDKYEKQLYG